jgi:hypothetical protein|tara:strand:- start:628 stop:747 length:120 start_codon:yes stop_codon:yes gene_type:complete
MNEDLKDYIQIILFLLFVLGGLVLLGSCDGGWFIAGYEV